MNGALLINKHAGVSSFGIVEMLQRELQHKLGCKRRDLPKFGHGGTLDPFATGVLLVLVGPAVKLARYFLGSEKRYSAVMRLGEFSVEGDFTGPVTRTSEIVPQSLQELQEAALQMMSTPYLQTPPMYSAKKKDGKPLYLLAREGLEVEREAKLCSLSDFKFTHYAPPRASFEVKCSAGTYIRSLAQDLAEKVGSVALLDALHRTASGVFQVEHAWTMEEILGATQEGRAWDELGCWIPFDELLAGYPKAQATPEERTALNQGKQAILSSILKKTDFSDSTKKSDDCVAIYCGKLLVGVARKIAALDPSTDDGSWEIERVFQVV